MTPTFDECLRKILKEYFVDKIQTDLDKRKPVEDKALAEIHKVIEGVLPNREEELNEFDDTWGDTNHDANSVKYGINYCLEQIKERMSK